MNKNISLKFRIFDILIIAISILVSVVLVIVILLTNNPYSNKRYVEIYHNNTCLEQYRIDLDTLDEQQKNQLEFYLFHPIGINHPEHIERIEKIYKKEPLPNIESVIKYEKEIY